MAIPSTPDRQRGSNAFARKRDAMVLRLLAHHPATAGMLTDLQLFPSRKKAGKRLLRLVKRRRIRLLGTVSLKGGRPEHVYGQRCKGDNLLHEVQLTRLCLKIHADAVRRGPGEVDPVLRPDAELLIAGQRFFVEMDCGTMSIGEVVRKRFAKYRSSPDLVLWVCPTESRKEALRSQAAMIRETALFTTLDEALQNPHAAIWVDVEGEKAALPRGGNRGEKPGVKGGAKGGAKGGSLAPSASGSLATPSPGRVAAVPREPSGMGPASPRSALG